MFYKSTRNSSMKITSSQAIVKGISPDGGLFVPEEIPVFEINDIMNLGNLSYPERAAFVFSKFLTDFTKEEIKYCTESAYNKEKFSTEKITEISTLCNGVYILELWHGPTCAFKDMALQILPYLLTASVKKTNIDKEIIILVATSGDTGKAALEGFSDVPGTRIMVFYPENGVSPMQKLQMTTQDGENVTVCAVKGNFDNCQNGVKEIFTSHEITNKLKENKMMFSSANSINWGRLAPQIIYYISAYAELVRDNRITSGEKVNIVVPTGNFGNILAAYYAKKMGLPVNKLICASNKNKVLTDFINTGIYDRNRDFVTTISPSMDILISSNLERLLYIMNGYNDVQIKEWFGSLASSGKYEVSQSVKDMLNSEFYGGCCDDIQTMETIKRVYDEYSYTLDTHTAVAVSVYGDYKESTGDMTKTIIASTASPYKFSESVLEAITGKSSVSDEFEMIDRLYELSGYEIPKSLSELRTKKIRFFDNVSINEQKSYILNKLFKN